jgi:uncharacterized membrane protein YeaQ/YmgE (transglycosylase-associated protein family)
MGILIILLLLALVFGAGIFITAGVVSLLLTVVVAGLVGWAADAVVPGRLPGGWIGAVLAGLVGGFIGHFLFSALHLPGTGLALAGVELIPAFVGAVIIAGGLELMSSRRSVA